MRFLCATIVVVIAVCSSAGFTQNAWALSGPSAQLIDLRPLSVGSQDVILLSPGVWEWRWIESGSSAKSGEGSFAKVPSGSSSWSAAFSPSSFSIETKSSNSSSWNSQSIRSVGFRRRAVFASKRVEDLRIESALIFFTDPLTGPTPSQTFDVRLRSTETTLPFPKSSITSTGAKGDLQTGSNVWTIEPNRQSPMIHISTEGYSADGPKSARLGYFLGSPGEWKALPADSKFQIISQTSNEKIVFEGVWDSNLDDGFNGTPTPYQSVYVADFSSVTEPGWYVLETEGIGRSAPFLVDDQLAARMTRTLALGLYHQRCGIAEGEPWTRFSHGLCHHALATIPESGSALGARHDRYLTDSGGTAQDAMKTYEGSHFPIQTEFKVDVTQGHHDAGDYSKYIINSAQLVHHLTFAADTFPGMNDWDSAGIPESGDGVGDLYQEAQWEADFLLKAQDKDGGFFFLVYPERRRYEDDTLPDPGDPQVVWPKNTSATAAATAALAQLGSSPGFQSINPSRAEEYMNAARKGWDFLIRAIELHGITGAYQKVTHYGDVFEDQDELIWAATEMAIATSDQEIVDRLFSWAPSFSSKNLKRWGWWRLFEGYGCAIRSWVFAPMQGKTDTAVWDEAFYNAAKQELELGAYDARIRAQSSAYGVSLPIETKRQGNVAWLFPSSLAFDLAVGCALLGPEDSANYRKSLYSNLLYEIGLNPNDVSYIAGLGKKRPNTIVSQFDQNQPREAPPTGILIGAIASGFSWLEPYGRALTDVAFPPYGSDSNSIPTYPVYERYTDVFNVTTESTVIEQARALASWAFLLSDSGLPDAQEPSVLPKGALTGMISLEIAPGDLTTNALDNFSAPAVGDSVNLRWVWEGLSAEQFSELRNPEVVWESSEGDFVVSGTSWSWTRKSWAGGWIEAEVCLRNGRRAFRRVEFAALNTPPQASWSIPESISFPQSVLHPIATVEDDAVIVSSADSANSGDAGTVKARWRVIGAGPDPLFLDQYTLSPFIHFRAPGDYKVQLIVSDGEFETVTERPIQVLAPEPWNLENLVEVESSLNSQIPDLPENQLQRLVKSRLFDIDDPDTQLTGATRWTLENRPWSRSLLEHVRPTEGQAQWNVIRVSGLEDTASWKLDHSWLGSDFGNNSALELSVWALVRDWKAYSQTNATLLGFIQEWDSKVEWIDPKWTGRPGSIFQVGGVALNTLEPENSSPEAFLPELTWGWLRIYWFPGGSSQVFWNGSKIAEGTGTWNTQRSSPWTLSLGSADADFADPILRLWETAPQ